MNRDRSQLGRGLAALLGDPIAAEASATVQTIPRDRLDPNPFQPRAAADPRSIEDLAASMRSQGILQPILVRPSPMAATRFEIIAGERRWRAAAVAGLSEVPCLVQNFNDNQVAEAALVENLQRLDLNALEEALGYERLQTRFQVTQESIADIVGKSRSHVANTLRLLKLPEPVQDQLRSGALSAGHARALLSHPDPVGAADQIVQRGLSVRQAEAMTLRAAEPRFPSGESKDVDTQAIERELAEQLGLSVSLRSNAGRGSLTLRFSRLEQLDLLIERLGRSGLPK